MCIMHTERWPNGRSTNASKRRRVGPEGGIASAEDQVDQSSDAVAIITPAETRTYTEIERRANRLANHLHALGIAPGQTVGVCTGRTPAMVVGVLGAHKCGARFVLLDPAHPEQHLAWLAGSRSAPPPGEHMTLGLGEHALHLADHIRALLPRL